MSHRSLAPASLFAMAAFFSSGFAALLDQVIWQRLLTFFSGADVFSVTIVVAAFMAGLGFGSLFGGRIADRLTTRACLIAFAIAELFIGGYAFISDVLFYDVLYQRIGALSLPTYALAGVLFLALLPPTFAMGASLPLLCRALTQRASTAAETIGTLYGINTLGSAFGAWVTTWWLMRSMSFSDVLAIGAGLNVFAAIAGLLAARERPDAGLASAHESAAEIATQQRVESSKPNEYRSLVGLFALAGFLALMLEIVWFRVLSVLLKANSFTFGTLLGIYLAGIGIGALLGRGPARRSVDPKRTFLWLQGLSSLYGLVSILVLYVVVRYAPWCAEVRHFLADFDPLNLALLWDESSAGADLAGRAFVRRMFLITHVIIPAFIVLPPTILSGASYPFLQRVVHERLEGMGSRVGLLQASNIAGSLLGTFAAGFVILPWIGTDGALRFCALIGLIFAVAALRRSTPRQRLAAGVVIAASIVGAIQMPSSRVLYACFHGVEPERVEVREDGTGVVTLVRDDDRPRARTLVLTNGRGESWLPFGRIHSLMGALPVLLHPDPKRVAIIGLGSGDTLYHASIREETTEVVCFEIVRGQQPALTKLAKSGDWPELVSMLEDPRLKIVHADGRRSLLRDRAGFDVIEADALRPNSAYSGSLYSLEYFELLRSRLRPGGIAVTWAPTSRVQRTFRRAFPYVLAIGPVLVGSVTPIEFDSATLLRRVEQPIVKQRLALSGFDLADVVQKYGADFQPLRMGFRETEDSGGDVNRDLEPRDEFLVPES